VQELITLLSLEEAEKRASEVAISEQFAALNVFRAMLHSPKPAGAVANLLTTLLFRGTLDARLRELVILRMGWRTASEYEFCQHVQVAKRLGIKEDEILGVQDPASCKAYNELDHAVIAMTDELTDGTEVSPNVWAILERSLSDAALAELLLVAGNWRMLVVFLKNARIPLDAGVPSWPEGRRPDRPD
jgi:alkylhydroperoxidase family enzyme